MWAGGHQEAEKAIEFLAVLGAGEKNWNLMSLGMPVRTVGGT